MQNLIENAISKEDSDLLNSINMQKSKNLNQNLNSVSQ